MLCCGAVACQGRVMRTMVVALTSAILMTGACRSPDVSDDAAGVLRVRVMDTLVLTGIDSLGYTTMTRPTRLTDGRILVAPLTDCGRVALFDSSGAFQGIIGRCGEGPGELGRIYGIVAAADGRLAIFHRGLMADGSIVNGQLAVDSAIVAPGFNRVIPLGDTGYLMSSLRLPGATTEPLRLYSPALELVNAFPSPFTSLDDDIQILQVAGIGDSAILVAPATGFEFTVVNLATGETAPVAVATRRFPTAKLKDLDRRQPDVVRPYPRILALRHVTDNMFLVVYSLPKPDWKPTRPDIPTPGEGPLMGPGEYARYMDYFVDAIDMTTGAVRGHATFPAAVVDFITDSTMFGYVPLPSGDVGLVRYQVASAH